MTLKIAEDFLCRFKPQIDYCLKMIIINLLEGIDQKEMTANQAQGNLNRKFPNLQRENLALWTTMMNLLDQVGNHKNETIKIVESKMNAA